jgi:flavin reductase (DIM6/NTAB) family NADH-FMN oxidoreductase RutF
MMETLTEARVNVLREPPLETSADAADLRPALADAWANVAAPVAVITMRDDAGRSHATTVTAFTSISFNPPVLMFALTHASSFLARIGEDSPIALSVLQHEQAHVAAACAAKAEDRLRDVTTLDEGWGPAVRDAAAWFGCTVNRIVDAGDHKLVFVNIEAASSPTPAHGLLYWQRRFGFSTPAA